MKKIILHIFTPLFIGAIIYLFFHQPNLVLHKYIHTVNFYANFKGNKIFIICLNHLPDILWAYSLSYFFFTFLTFKKSILKLITIVLVLLFSECIQLFYPKIFTFDILDITLMVATSLIVYYKLCGNEK
jgi:hypothetical protein